MTEKRTTYHHGDLRAALIQAADDIIAEGGIEVFSLRAAAKRAGVSPGATAHHFGSAKGLLTEVALLAYERVGKYLSEVGDSNNAVTNVRALTLAFITFAVDHPGHFRLMFRGDLVNRDDSRFDDVTIKTGKRLSDAIAAYHGKPSAEHDAFEDRADIFIGMATAHGIARMIIDEKSKHLFHYATAQEFLKVDLLKVLARIYPEHKSADGDN